MSRSNLIVVTGFGPFKGYEQKNPSWEAVKLLPDTVKLEEIEYNIQKFNVPVEFTEVDKIVNDIWPLEPLLVIHCGVDRNIRCIKLETKAKNGEFTDTDFAGKCLPNPTIPIGCQSLNTALKVDMIVQALNNSFPEDLNPFCTSDDVGNYLCCYIYLKSMSHCNKRTLFIHVPPNDDIFTPEFTSECIQKVIERCIKMRLDDLNNC